jgi:WD40 repeat protein
MFIKQFEFSDHSGPVYCITKHNNAIYSSGADKFIVRWDLTNLKQDNFVIQLEYSAYSMLHLSQDPLLVIGCSNGDLHIINTKEKKEIKFIQHHKSAIFTIIEIPEKQLIITGDADGNVCIWNSSNLSLLLQIPLNSGKIRAIEYLNNELIIGCKDGKIRFFDLVFFNQIVEIPINTDGIQAIKMTDKIAVIGGRFNSKKVINFSYCSEKKTKKIISLSRYAIANRENLFSFFAQDCLAYGLIVFYNSQFKNYQHLDINNFIPINMDNSFISVKEILRKIKTL